MLSQARLMALDTLALAVQASRERFEAQRDRYVKLRDEMARHRNAANAAETEAAELREQSKGLIRQLTGSITGALRDLKAKERAAYALAEDYRELVEEVGDTLTDEESEANRRLSDYCGAVAKLRHAYGDTLIAEGMAQLPPALIAGVRLKASLAGGFGPLEDWREVRLDPRAPWQAELLGPLLGDALNRPVDNLPDPVIEEVMRRTDSAGLNGQFSPGADHVRRVKKEQAAVKAEAERQARMRT